MSDRKHGGEENGWKYEDPLEAVFSLWKSWKNDERRLLHMLYEFVDEKLYADKLRKPSEQWQQEIRIAGLDYELHCNHRELNNNYRKLLGIENEKSAEKVIEVINSKLLTIREQEIHKVKEEIIGLAAVYGEEIISKCGGEWQLIGMLWGENQSFILGIHGRICKRINPLDVIIQYVGSEGEDKEYFLEPFHVDDEIFV